MSDVLDLGTLVGYMKLDNAGWNNPLLAAGRGLEGFKGKALLAMSAIGAAGVGAAVGLYKVGEVFDDLSDTIANQSGASGAHLDRLVETAKKVGTEIPVSFDKIGPVVATLNKRLGLTGPVLEQLAEQFLAYEKISGRALDPAEVTATFKAYSVDGKDASRTLDQLFKISRQTQVPLDSLLSSVKSGSPVFHQYGLDIGQSAQLLGALEANGLTGSRVVQGLNKASAEFVKEGIPMRKGLQDTVTSIDALLKKGDDAGAKKIADKLFGNRGSNQFIAAVKSGALSVDSLTKKTTEHGKSIIAAEKSTQDFAEQWELFRNRTLVAIEPLAAKVFGALGTGMAWVNSTGVPALASLSDNFDDVGHAILRVNNFAHSNETTIKVVAGVITALLLPALIAWGVQSLIAAGRSVAAWVAAKVGAAQSAALQILSLTLLTAQWIRSGVVAVASAARQVAAWLLSKAEVAGTIVLYGIAFAMMAAGWIASAAAATAGAIAVAAAWLLAIAPIAIVVAAIAGIVFLIIKHWGAIKDATAAVWHWIVNTVSGAVTTVIDFVKAHWPLILAIITGPIGLAVLYISKHLHQIVGFFSDAWSAVRGNAKAAWNGIGNIISNGVAAIVGWVRAVPGKLRAMASSWASAGRSLINAFVGGMKNAGGVISGIAGNVWNAVRGMINSAIRKINAALNFTIHLPGPDAHINAGHIPMLAKGGYADKATLGVFAEAGPEVVLPLDSPKTKQAMSDALGPGPGNSDELAAQLGALLDEVRDLNDNIEDLSNRPVKLEVGGRQAGEIVRVGDDARKRL